MQRNSKSKDKKKTHHRNQNDPSQTEEFIQDVKNNKWNYGIMIFISVLIFLSFYLQYRYEMSQRLNRSSDADDDIDYYSVLGVDYGADLQTIKQKYKELTKIWHPDKNKNCASCQEKFLLISKAHEVLTDEKKRGELRDGSGSMFSSGPIFLNERNYHKLVEESNDFWVILVFENTRGNNYNKYVAEVFDEVNRKLKHIIKFGVIDVLTSHQLLHFIPYKFQYFPNIYTYQHGEGSELFENLDLFSVTTLIKFIEDVFPTKVSLINDSYLNNMLTYDKEPVDITNKPIGINDVDLTVLVLSPKSSIDLITKDFAVSYKNSVKVYQNDLGFYDKCQRLFKSDGSHQVFLIYNSLTKTEENRYLIQKTHLPIPVKFSYKLIQQKLQQAFHFIKLMTLQRIYRNNYHSHCFNKVHIDGEEVEVKKNVERGMDVNICVILLERENNNPNLMKSFLSTINSKFNEKIGKTKKNVKKGLEEYDIEINFGIADLSKNKNINALYNKYKEDKEIKEDNADNLFLIINDTNEKFSFRSFKDDNQLKEYFDGLDNGDYFEDISFSFEYFGNYEIRNISELFAEEKIFSIEKIVMSAIYAQMQASYIFAFLVLLLSNHYFFKYNTAYFFLSILAGSILLSFGYNIFTILYN